MRKRSRRAKGASSRRDWYTRTAAVARSKRVRSATSMRRSHGGDRGPLVRPGEGGHPVGVPAHPGAVQRREQSEREGSQQEAGGSRLRGAGEPPAAEVLGVEAAHRGDRVRDLEEVAGRRRGLCRTFPRQGPEEGRLDPRAVGAHRAGGQPEGGGPSRTASSPLMGERYPVEPWHRWPGCATLVASPHRRRRGAGLARAGRHPLAPGRGAGGADQAARHGGGSADQTAITVWLGEGPRCRSPAAHPLTWRRRRVWASP